MASSLASRLRSSYVKKRRWAQALQPFVVATLKGERRRRLADIRRDTAIASSAGVDELVPLEINGVRQWLRLRGWDTTNPVLLYLHGGPGGTSLPFRRSIAEWERHFTVVHWEQRGAGKSYRGDIDPQSMTLEQLVADASSVIDQVLDRFAQPRLILLGHSWGSFLAAHLIPRAASKIAVYVGTGQVGDMVESERVFFEFALAQARQRGHEKALADLARAGNYPTGTARDHRFRPVVRGWARQFGFTRGTDLAGARNQTALMDTEEYSLRDIYGYLKGTLFSQALADALFDPAQQPLRTALDLPVPVVLLSGAHDSFTATAVAQRYFDALRAPSKRQVVFDQSGHWPMIDEADAYLDALREHVRPYIAA